MSRALKENPLRTGAFGIVEELRQSLFAFRGT
jgi:hypothetical protein